MIIAIWTTFVLAIAALTAAMTLTWRRWTAQAARPCRVEACGCYPRARR